MALQSLVSNMDRFFASSTRSSPGSPPRHKARGEGENQGSQVVTTEWVMNGVSAALTVMGEAMEERVSKAEAVAAVNTAEIENLKEANKELEQQVKSIGTSVAEMQRVASENCDTRSTPQLSQPPGLQTAQSLPFEQRTIAVIGNLGYDTEGPTIISRAKELPEEAEITPNLYTVFLLNAKRAAWLNWLSMTPRIYRKPDLQSSRSPRLFPMLVTSMPGLMLSGREVKTSQQR